MSRIAICFVLMGLSSTPAFAYIDPGSGSAILSMLIGLFVALGVIVKTFWYKILSLLGLSRPERDLESHPDSDGE